MGLADSFVRIIERRPIRLSTLVGDSQRRFFSTPYEEARSHLFNQLLLVRRLRLIGSFPNDPWLNGGFDALARKCQEGNPQQVSNLLELADKVLAYEDKLKPCSFEGTEVRTEFRQLRGLRQLVFENGSRRRDAAPLVHRLHHLVLTMDSWNAPIFDLVQAYDDFFELEPEGLMLRCFIDRARELLSEPRFKNIYSTSSPLRGALTDELDELLLKLETHALLLESGLYD